MMMMMMTMMVTWKPVAEVISGQRPWMAVRMEADTSKEGRTCVEKVIFVILIINIIMEADTSKEGRTCITNVMIVIIVIIVINREW